ncbi:terminase gpA endonuclease subunit [Hyphobacterium sp.]|uniref:terminase gpA endonuclease subunit n=1 Tax=Hyphobacterium sp. TaxID=2004662 RepID=UPI003BAC7A0F
MLSPAFESLANGAAVAMAAYAAAFEPPEEITVSDWAEKYRFLGSESGSRFVGKWRNARTPYGREIMDVCGLDHPSRSVRIRGSAQIAKSEFGANAIFHMACTDPRSTLVVLPSQEEFQKWNKVKFNTTVEATPELQKHIVGTRSRSEDGSTGAFKRLRGDGFIQLTTASSSKGLQGLPVGFILLEEITEYDADVGNRGDPVTQARARMLAQGDDGKEILISTPGMKGDCAITEAVEEGDHRKLYVKCPNEEYGAGRHWHRWEFDQMNADADGPYFECPECGHKVREQYKKAMVAEAVFVPCFHSPNPDPDAEPGAENPDNPAPPLVIFDADLIHWVSPESLVRAFGPEAKGGRDTEGRHPSFDVWQAYSTLGSWTKLWEEYEKTQSDPSKLKPFYQQFLGQPYEVRGDAPDEEKLHEAWVNAGLERGRIPDWACILTGFTDVQGNRLEWGVYAWGPNPGFIPGARGRLIDHGVIDGDPENAKTWSEMAQILERTYEGPRTVPLRFDRWGVDAGYKSPYVYLFCSGRPGVLATKGTGDPDAPELGTPKKMAAKFQNKVLARADLYPLGQYGLKKRIYFGLKQGLVERSPDGPGELQAGALEFHAGCDLGFFKQITAEHLNPRRMFKNQPVWDKPEHQANEQLDIAVGARAMAWNYGVDRLNEAGWRQLMASRAKDPTLAAALPFDALWDAQGKTAEAIKPTKPAPANPSPKKSKPSWLERQAKLNRGETGAE